MKKLGWMALIMVSGLASVGCTHTFTALATQAITPGASADVVWVLRDGDRVFRCIDTAEGPRCSEARIATR